MKKLLITLLLTTSPVFAGFARLNASCAVNPQMASCQVYNHLNFPVFCNVRAVGMTRFGANADMYGNGWVYPGQSMYVNVYAFNPYNDPLVAAQAFANCQF